MNTNSLRGTKVVPWYNGIYNALNAPKKILWLYIFSIKLNSKQNPPKTEYPYYHFYEWNTDKCIKHSKFIITDLISFQLSDVVNKNQRKWSNNIIIFMNEIDLVWDRCLLPKRPKSKSESDKIFQTWRSIGWSVPVSIYSNLVGQFPYFLTLRDSFLTF